MTKRPAKPPSPAPNGPPGCSASATARWSTWRPSAELWLDGGHNPAAGEILAAHFAGGGDRKLHLIAGMLNTKDATGFFRPLKGIATEVQTVAIPEEANSLPPDVLAGFAREAGLEARVALSVEAAMAAIPPGPSRVLICGSLYLAGTVLSKNG